MKVEFFPEPGMLEAIAKEIKSSHRAFPVFGTAKLFLSKPDRHCVRLTALDDSITLFQVGDGPIAQERALVERDAFRNLKEKYYSEEVVQGEPPKGIFTSVAKLRASGLLLGPTSHHGYQPTLRRIYEERYSRRMSFAEFQQHEIEIVKDEQSVNDWKEQARSTTTYSTKLEAEPVTFKSLAEVEAHFRTKYLPQEVKSGRTLETGGPASRHSGDRGLNAAMRDAFDREMGFPSTVVNHMRPALVQAGLHFFKHRKRMVYASSIRPHRYPVGQPARDSVLNILRTIEANPRCTRHDLGVKLLGENFEAPERVVDKTALATDLHYLLIAGHVIEFADGRLDVPLPPKGAEPAAPAGKAGAAAPATAAAAGATAAAAATEEAAAAQDEVSSEEAEVEEAPISEPSFTEAPVAEESTAEASAPAVVAEDAPTEPAPAALAEAPAAEVVPTPEPEAAAEPAPTTLAEAVEVPEPVAEIPVVEPTSTAAVSPTSEETSPESQAAPAEEPAATT